MRRYSFYLLGVYVWFVQLLLAAPSLAATVVAKGPPDAVRVQQLRKVERLTKRQNRDVQEVGKNLASGEKHNQVLAAGREVHAGSPTIKLSFPGGCLAEGYAVAVQWDPRLLRLEADSSQVRVWLRAAALHDNGPSDPVASGMLASSKERIAFPTTTGSRTLHLPRNVRFVYLNPVGDWQQVGAISQHPAAVVRKGHVVFAFDPTAVIRYHLNMMDTTITDDVLDWMVSCVLTATGRKPTKPDEQWRDFHALGVATWMVERLAKELEQPFDAAPIRRLAIEAAKGGGDLAAAFSALADARRRITELPVYFIDILHGGILIGRQGFGEYDWPQAAADLLDFYLDWNRRFGYRYSHDVGAGTLYNLAPMFPKTIKRLRTAWEKGEIEFANGTWSQPYLHLWSQEECRQQFIQGHAAFDELFGRHPTTYASQEFALHPALPDVLRSFGYERAIHRAMLMGSAPEDDRPLIDWEGVGGATIPALPSHSPKSEKLGSNIYLNWPRLVAATHAKGLPFAALVNFHDQTFIGTYKEEFVRACRHGKSLGQFVTCEGFFSAVADVPRERVRYRWDDYVFDLEMPTKNYHRYESGGFSTTIEYWRGVVEELRQREATTAEWRRVLDGEAHDIYVLPNFKTGAFLDLYLTDYAGPRYRVTTDERRGVTRFIRDAVDFPAVVNAALPVPMEGDQPVELDEATGGVVVEGKVLGALVSTRGASHVVSVKRGVVTRVVVRIDGVGNFNVRYWFREGTLYGLVERPAEIPWFRHDVSYWDDCVYLRHVPSARDASVVRYYGGIAGATRHAQFYSRERVRVGPFHFLHGGNGFFRVADGELHNRLWSHNETSRSFWWAVRRVGKR